MKTCLSVFSVGLATLLSAWAINLSAAVEMSAGLDIHAEADFQAPLAEHGTWIEVESYGRCWHPAHVAADWEPYCNGHWLWTDCGWYWASDEPWAWACYHYGCWVRHPSHGWIWRPDIEWAPAWVSWRVGGGYIGWAPCAPPRLAVSLILPAPPFLFVEMGHFHEPIRRSKVFVNETRIVNKTKVINNIREETKVVDESGPRKVMVNEGPGLAAIQKETSNKVQIASLQQARRETPIPPSLERRKTEWKTKEKPANENQTKLPPDSTKSVSPSDGRVKSVPPEREAPSNPDKVVPQPKEPSHPGEDPGVHPGKPDKPPDVPASKGKRGDRRKGKDKH